MAFESIAIELARMPDVEVTLFGSGQARSDRPYEFVHSGCIPRERFERWPSVPVFRSEYVWEELSFVPGWLRNYRSRNFDITVTCSYPFMNWALRAFRSNRSPAHVYVTQNGDHPAATPSREYRFFGCEGLVCTNPEYYERNKSRWLSRLIPNGVDPSLFLPGPRNRADFDLPSDVPMAMVVSALIRSKRVDEGIRAAAKVPGLHLLVCGHGPERDNIIRLGKELMGDRFHHRTLPRERMPEAYRCADVFLHMSLNEPSANAYIEALASGLPIVTHDRDVTRWTLEDKGVLVDATSADLVAEALSKALQLSSRTDIEARVKMAETRFSWSGIANQYHDFFLEIIERRKAARP